MAKVLTIDKLLKAQGAIFAETMHECVSLDRRAGCHAAWRNQYKLVMDGLMSHERFTIMEVAFKKRLMELEPIDSIDRVVIK